MADVVLDASAVLALLNREPGGERVENYLGEGVISAVNAAEVVRASRTSCTSEYFTLSINGPRVSVAVSE